MRDGSVRCTPRLVTLLARVAVPVIRPAVDGVVAEVRGRLVEWGAGGSIARPPRTASSPFAETSWGIVDAGKLGDRLPQIAKVSGQVAHSMRSTLTSDEIQLQFGVRITGEAGFWFSAKVSGEGRSR
jgi:hypothetical protein